MKKIEAIIRQSKLYDVLEALNRHKFYGITVTQVVGCGLQKGVVKHYRGAAVDVNLLPKMKLELVVKENWLKEVIDVIMEAARTGDIGDGKIFVYDLENAYRIRTGETGERAIQ